MKIICETTLVNRQYPQAKNRTQKSTVAIGTHPPNEENPKFFILVFTAQNKTGTRYKIKDNIQKVYTKCLNEGKISISFKDPGFDLQIKGDPIQIKAFLNVLKLALQGRRSNDSGQQVISHVTTVTKHDTVKKKLIIHSRKDYPIKGLPRTLTHLEMSGLQFCRVDSQVFLLKNLTHLDLNTNLIERIPTQLGDLRLQEINFASNNLGGSSWKWLTGRELSQSLCILNLSDNKLTFFPFALTKLKNLTKLIINTNEIRKLPFAMRNMKSLRYFDASKNLLSSLPDGINLPRFDTLDISDNPFLLPEQLCLALNVSSEFQVEMSSLFELAARQVISHCIPYSPATLPQIIIDVMEASPLCLCGAVCINRKVYEHIKPHENLRCEALVKDQRSFLTSDSVFCSRRCLARQIILFENNNLRNNQ